MWIFRILIILLVLLTLVYYVTVCVHIVSPIYTRKCKEKLLWIPFYGWIKDL